MKKKKKKKLNEEEKKKIIDTNYKYHCPAFLELKNKTNCKMGMEDNECLECWNVALG